MPFRKEIDENLRFLILEVRTQVQAALGALSTADAVSFEKISSRDDYIDNLKGVIESKCFSQIFHEAEFDKPTVDAVKAVLVVNTNLERIADYSVNIVGQTEYFKQPDFLQRYEYRPFFTEIFAALDLVYEAVHNTDIQLGLRICRSEVKTDELYKEVFRAILEELRKGRDTENLLTSIFIFRYLERIGDSLLNIGEAIISAAVGEKLKIHQYRALEETLEQTGAGADVSEIDLESIWETRSGCRIARIHNRDGDGDSKAAIFKEGVLRKLQDERANIERLESMFPGLPPKIYGFEEHGSHGSLLLEYFSGSTLKEIMFNRDERGVARALGQTFETLRTVWERTIENGAINAGFFSQLLSRIAEVHRVHPDYRGPGHQIGSLEKAPFEDLLRRASHIDEVLDAPFSVLIHGDFNIDNVIIDTETGTVHFIDLHRSRDTDYIQDVSVFMVSSFRLPVEDSGVRRRLNLAIRGAYEFGREFAERHEDKTFEARLTLGLVRSFATSTRFELQEEFAKSMYLRAVFLLEKILAHDGRPWEEFRLPKEALEY